MTHTEALAAQCARLFFSVGGGHEVAQIREHQLATVCESAITLATLQLHAAIEKAISTLQRVEYDTVKMGPAVCAEVCADLRAAISTAK